ncbi:MAG TPA: hypothetical protein VGY66_12350 [Gemmataceae bacterium]|jgi:hypothetical protein|nr:hypothetical protein [Gemmataceae bacterium]
MDNPKMQECTICGEERSAGQVWFLVAESHWEDKLKVLQWQEELARRRGIYAACSAGHVEELVVHWMTTGSLDYPFATVGLKPERQQQRRGWILPTIEEPDTKGARLIGELAVDRESVRRALREDPDSLQVILDELLNALERETTGTTARFESADAMCYGFPRQI